MTAPSCGCRVDRLCADHFAERQQIVAERLAYLNHRGARRQPTTGGPR